MRPRLPVEIERIFPSEIVHHIYTFVPHQRKESIEKSPTFHKEMKKIQSSPLKGVKGTFMYDLDDFCLD
jgi:hypothetical protein